MTIDVLPPEVLATILRKVKKSDHLSNTKDLFSVLTVSRKWSERALTAIWRAVALNSVTDIRRFSHAARSFPAASLVQSIAVSINPDRLETVEFGRNGYDLRYYDTPPSSQGSTALGASLSELARLLRELKRLRSFSLKVIKLYPGWRRTERLRRFLLHPKHLRKLLRCLPASLEDLELDTGGAERRPSTMGTCHLCTDLRGLFSRLRHIRLRLGMICPKLFLSMEAEATIATTSATKLDGIQANSKLESLVLNLINLEGVALCNRGGQHLFHGYPLLLEPYAMMSPEEHAQLAQTAQVAFTQGGFSALKEVRLIDKPSRSAGGCTAIIDKHLLANLSYVSPYAVLTADTPCLLRMQDTTGQKHEYFCNMQHMSPHIEGPQWLTTTENFRFCREFTETAVAKERAYTYRSLEVVEGWEKVAVSGLKKPAWRQREEKTGEWWIDPLVVKGVGVIEAPRANWAEELDSSELDP